MTAAKAVHWNPPETDRYRRFTRRTRCGEWLTDVQHRPDPHDATCNRCQAYAQKDGVM